MRPSVGILPTLDWHWRDCVTTAVAVGCDEASDDLPLLRAGRFSHLLRKSGRGAGELVCRVPPVGPVDRPSRRPLAHGDSTFSLPPSQRFSAPGVVDFRNHAPLHLSFHSLSTRAPVRGGK